MTERRISTFPSLVQNLLIRTEVVCSMDSHTLPEPPAMTDELGKLRYQAELEDWASRRIAERQTAADEWKLVERRRDEQVQAETALREAIHAAYLEVGKTSVERSLQRATFVTTAAGSIATIYSGLLALVYSVSRDHPNPMPATGIGPAVFLGLSLVLSSFYVAYLDRRSHRARHLAAGVSPALQEARLAIFVNWVVGSSLHRAWALRLSVLALAVGVALAPVPFLDLALNGQWVLMGVGGLLLLGTAGYELARNQWKDRPRAEPDQQFPDCETRPEPEDSEAHSFEGALPR